MLRILDDASCVVIPFDDNESIFLIGAQSTHGDFECESSFVKRLQPIIHPEIPENIIATILIRQGQNNDSLFVYHDPSRKEQNVRATRLSLSCGMFSYRFHGTVVLVRKANGNNVVKSLEVDDVYTACCISPDFRSSTLRLLKSQTDNEHEINITSRWLEDACRSNYHDTMVLQKIAKAMSNVESADSDDSTDESHDERMRSHRKVYNQQSLLSKNQFITKVPLCLHCRKPTTNLCSSCLGAYFCPEPSSCRLDGWSHNCLCETWRVYVENRTILSHFLFLGDWCKELTSRPFQLSCTPYEDFLARSLGETPGHWWETETSNWAGGTSTSARSIDLTIRRSFAEGFYPLSETYREIPPECRVSNECVLGNALDRNEVGFLRLKSWSDYYKLREINENSIASLLLTFPLTLYFSLVEYCEAPCVVATTLKRRLRIHIVGSEKELNFLDIFREISYLLDERTILPFGIELVFVVREDMIPVSSSYIFAENGRQRGKQYAFHLNDTIQVFLVSGVYGDEESLDPNFDCGSGKPDVIMAFNAGLYAYASWRTVLTYLDNNADVVGAFTDYNEYSGVQCASLGGYEGRHSLRINPFRQPRAMPVYSMNLPQFANGFIYVFNRQVLE